MRYLLVIFSWSIFIHSYPARELRPFHLSGHAQGTTWQITYYDRDSTVLTSEIDSILEKLDSSLSLYKPYSLISTFNEQREKICMDGHLQKVVEQSFDTYTQTNGLFDITVQPLVEAWGFSFRKPEEYPDSLRVRALLSCIGTNKLFIKDNWLFKAKPCIRIDLDGIAQGYSVDVLADFLEQRHISNYMVELGGELRFRGKKQPSGEKMKIGIEAPGNNEFESSPLYKILCVDSGAITTSGNYRAFHEQKGKRFSHTIDPRTGYPSENELISVTVYAAKAMTADA